VGGRGVPLSPVVTGANRHDVTQLDAVLQAIVVKRKTPSNRRSKHLCADAGYRGRSALKSIEAHGRSAHVVSRPQEAECRKSLRDIKVNVALTIWLGAMNESTFTFRVEEELEENFASAAKASDRTGAQLLRDFMREFVKKQQDAAEHGAWFHRQVQVGLDSANAGNLVLAGDVEAEFA